MAVRDYWDRMLIYFGIAEAAYDDEPEAYADDEEPRRPQRGSARSESGTGAGAGAEAPRARSSSSSNRRPPSAPRTRPPTHNVGGVGVVSPRTFNDAQQIADQLKRGSPVIVNLQVTSTDLAKRIIDFGSGLTYGLDGSMQRIADKVFLLTPPDVDVSAEDRAAMVESGFFNQS